MDLEPFDTAILRELAADGPINATALADRIGLSKTPVLARIKRLEAAGVILGYRADLDPVKRGRALVAFGACWVRRFPDCRMLPRLRPMR